MATLYTQQSSNTTKTWLLMTAFLGVVVGLGFFVSVVYNNQVIFYAAIILSLVMNVASFWYSDKIALSLAGAKAINPEGDTEHLELKRIVENLAITAGLPTPRIYIIDDVSPNAFATGRDKNHAAIAVTTGLLSIMEKSELEGVLAHELAHVGNRDILLSSAVIVLVGFITIISDMFLRSMWFGGRSRDDDRGGNPLMIVGIIFIILSPILATLLQLAISRKREYLADATGALITRYPEGLANALEKIASSTQAPLIHASNATAHLYISNPFGAKAVKGISALFMTHPPIEERIRILREGRT
ncbi:MAG: M48 family metalloprotease [Candidatus Paceibacterota bacterium]|jgi:heat shock protein HtpX